MRAFLVVAVHGLVDEQAGLGPVVGEHEEEFVFEDAIDPFGQRVLVAIAAVGHRAAPFRFLLGRLVGIGGILAALPGTTPVRIVDAAGGGLAGLAYGPVQGGQAAGRMQAGMDVMAHNTPGTGIGDQAQADRTLAGGQVGDIADPQLIRRRRFRGVFDQVGVLVEAVMRIDGRGVAALAGHQQPVPAQQGEQGIAPAGHALDA